MRALLYAHDACQLHSNGPDHPERAERIGAAVSGVHDAGVVVVEREAPVVEREALLAVHESTYVASIEQLCVAGGGAIDLDTGVVAESWEAALRSAGAGLAAVSALRAGEGDMAFLATRPPGHHALSHSAMGFCLFNNVAVTAAALAGGGESVAIIDWDVHHGNGTQSAFYRSEDIVYLSLHQFPFYPGSGWVDESGRGKGLGHTINIPLPSGSGGDSVRAAVERIITPVLDEFDPDWLLVSAGYDAHVDDPLGGLRYEADDYGWMARLLTSQRLPRVVFFLEGGYDLDGIRGSVEATIRGCAGEPFSPSPGPSPAGSATMIRLAAVAAAAHWPGVQAG